MIRVVVAGTSPFGIPSFTALAQSPDITVVGVVTQPARPLGRHLQLTPTPVATWATENHLPLLTPKNWKERADLSSLRAWKPDVLIVAAYGLIVPAEFLAIPIHGCINIHASLLPAYRGASPIAAAILQGDHETGVTFMQMDAGLDTGGILSQHVQAFQPSDTTPIVMERLAALAAQHCVATVTKVVEGTLQAKPQPADATYAKKISRADGQADWSSAVMLERKIRAYTPWPGVWTIWRGTEVKLLAGHVVASQSPKIPLGTIVALEKGHWAITCADGLFEPTHVQFAGKKAQTAGTIPGGYPGFIGSQLGA